jgi:hypothetical protein
VVHLIDYEQRHLVPVPPPGVVVEDSAVVRVEGTVAGRAFATCPTQDVAAEPGHRRL